MPRRRKHKWARGDLVFCEGDAGEVIDVSPLAVRMFKTGTVVNPRVSKVSGIWEMSTREKNPWVALPFLLGTVTGAGLIFFKVGGSIDAQHDFRQLSDCQGGILLIAPSKSLYERGIDYTTGGNGYSHSALYLCLVDEEQHPLIVDCQHNVGVQIRPLTEFKERQIAFIPLSAADTAYARGAALARLGLPYRGRPNGLTCSEFVATCLPPAMRMQIKDKFVTPNSIATAFKVPPPGGGHALKAVDLAERLKF